MKKIASILSIVIPVFFVFCESSEAGIRENMIMAKVPKKYKSWNYEYPATSFKILQHVGYGEEPYSAVIKLEEFSYIVMEGIYVSAKKLSNGNKRKAYDAVRFGWKIKITNTSSKSCKFLINVNMHDSEDFDLGLVGYEKFEIAGGETKTFQADTFVKLTTLKKMSTIKQTLEDTY